MRFVSCFSGIEAASAAWLPLGCECIGVSEVNDAARAVLAHHYPDVPTLGDVLADDFLDRIAALSPDALVGGPPCQDFSVAGLRAGIHGHRGNLTLRWVQIIHASNARFAVTENVPGWLSANEGHAFGAFLAGLVGHDTDLLPPRKCGGKWTNAGMVAGPKGRAAWRILDAQFFGLAQRRKRVFVVFCPGDRGDPAAVLLEPHSLRGDSPQGREAREDITGTFTARTTGGGGLGTDFECSGGQTAATLGGGPQAFGGNNQSGPIDVATALNACATASGRQDFETETFIAHTLRAEGFDASEDGTGRGTPLAPVAFQDRFRGDDGRGYDRPPPVSEDICGTLETVKPWNVATAFDCEAGGNTGFAIGDTAGALRTGGHSHGHSAVHQTHAVRRLTPVECCRLQGFPDNYLDVTYRGKPLADGQRYRLLGNSFAVPVVAWIGRRIIAVDRASRLNRS